MNITIKKDKENNLLDIARLDAEVWLDAYNKNFSKKFLKERLANIEETSKKIDENITQSKEFYTCAYDNDKMIGYISYKKSDNLRHINDGMITNLYVLSDYQNKEVGTRLVKEALLDIKERFNRQNIILEILKGNSWALRFFKSFGADVIGTTMTQIDSKTIRKYLLYLENIDKAVERIDNKEFIK